MASDLSCNYFSSGVSQYVLQRKAYAFWSVSSQQRLFCLAELKLLGAEGANIRLRRDPPWLEVYLSLHKETAEPPSSY